MVKNYFKIAFRNLKKNKGFTAINIIGLAIGMAAAILIFLWVSSQLNFDKMYPKANQLYAVGSIEPSDEGLSVWFSTPKPLASVVKNDIPEVKTVSRVSNTGGFLFTIGDKKIVAGPGRFVDSTFLDLFALPVLAGNPKSALKNPSNIVLTEGFALSFFGSTDIIGETIKIDSSEYVNVSAVIEDIPSNSRFADAEYLLPWTFMEKIGYSDESWGNSSVALFIELDQHVNLESVQQKFKRITKTHSELKTENFLKQINEQYLYSEYKNGVAVGGPIEMVKIFIIIATFILLIACINFMNLSTARSEKRAKEVGIRKVVGAHRVSLIWQFLSESLLLAFASGVISVLIVILLLPSFSDLVGRKLSIPFNDLRFWLSFISFVLFTGFLAGSYPAFFLSSFQPIKVLKGKFIHIQQKFNPRKSLVVTQFTIAIVLIISTLVIRQQLQHVQERDSGYSTENIIYLSEKGDIKKNVELIRHVLIEKGIASSVSRTMSPMTERWSGWDGFSWDGKDPNSIIQFNRQSTDSKIVETIGLELIDGRDFDLNKFPTDSMSAIINETAAKIMGFKNPIGNYFMDGEDKFLIIGVVKDFIQESPFRSVLPTVIEGAQRWLNTIHIRFNPEIETGEALRKTEEIFKQFNPDYPFEYHFLDEAYAKKFEETKRTSKLATIFTGLTIFISCLGLFGLAAYMAESRTKEIGVRKVLGASIFSVTKMLSQQFIILICISCVIAFPLAYWAMAEYLSGYAYRTDINWEIFVITAALAIAITLLTVSYQSIKTALANPVDSLRDE
ncbi:FtsX-like permease family protein [Sphingobacterium shayense]|uniref:ABC transporter permease n=1 Tax=Sphingobacterium shayense TaxID=626343 RepID=UPI001551D1BF|nr:ABC transporter permease [Sphingobacterium shayense]NQD70392.1 FtsX-like permease family protein [Sphingobacterium shayense]